MKRQQTYAALSPVASADLNSFQDRGADVLATNGLLLGGDQLSCTDGATISISRVRALSYGSAANASGIVLSNGAAATFTPTTDTDTSEAIVANTWYYVYAYNSGTPAAPVLAFECGSVGPDTDRVFKSTDASRRYVGAFHTRAAATSIHCFTATRGLYQYRRTAMGQAYADAEFHLINQSTNFAAADTDLSAFVPPNARFVDLFAQVASAAGGGAPSITVIPSGTPDSTYVNTPAEWTVGTTFAAFAGQNYGRALTVPIGAFVFSLVSKPAIKIAFGTSSSAAGELVVTGWRE